MTSPGLSLHHGSDRQKDFGAGRCVIQFDHGRVPALLRDLADGHVLQQIGHSAQTEVLGERLGSAVTEHAIKWRERQEHATIFAAR